ncbi:MAG: NAD(P)H-binding protein [Pseudomonadota bacterium]
MKVIIFGATGMVGQGVMRECLNDAGVTEVLSVGRTLTGLQHAKLKELVHGDLLDYTAVEKQLAGYDACFFCLGATAAGRTEAEYAAINYAIPVAAGTALARLNPGMTLTYVSGAGTDSTGQGRIMWARVKGRTENDLLRLPLKAFMFRPGAIQPMNGEVSKTVAYRVLITLFKPLFPVMRGLMPDSITTTERMGLAMLNVARAGYSRPILEVRDINAAASGSEA